jgi:flagellar biosynthesis protein FlhB
MDSIWPLLATFGNGLIAFFYSASSSSIKPKSAKMADEKATWQLLLLPMLLLVLVLFLLLLLLGLLLCSVFFAFFSLNGEREKLNWARLDSKLFRN